MKNEKIKIFISFLIVSIFFTIPFFAQKNSIYSKPVTCCDFCLQLENIQSDLETSTKNHSCFNSNCSKCIEISKQEVTLLELINSQHRCFESNKMVSYNNIINNNKIDLIILFNIILLSLTLFLIDKYIIKKLPKTTENCSLVLLKVKLSN